MTPGCGVAFAGTDITAGETVLRRAQLLTSRDTGVLAAIGVAERRRLAEAESSPSSRPATRSSPPAQPMQPAQVYDSNAQVLADCRPRAGRRAARLGIIADDAAALRTKLHEALADCRCRAAFRRHQQRRGRPVVSRRRRADRSGHRRARRGAQAGQADLPGGDRRQAGGRAARLSDVGDLHVSRVRRAGDLACWRAGARERRDVVPARLAVKVNSEIGRTEYLLVESGRRRMPAGRRSPRIRWDRARAASPRSAAPTALRPSAGTRRSSRRAAGRRAAARPRAAARRSGRDRQPLHRSRLSAVGAAATRRASKFITVGSSAGLDAARRGECDLAGIHLLDPQTGEYNRPFLDARWS